MGKAVPINRDINLGRERHSCESSPRRSSLGEAEGSLGRNPGKYWIPPYQVRGKLSRARNNDPLRTSVVK